MSDLLFSFEGRIGRGRFWLGIVLTVVYTLVASIVLGLLAGAVAGEAGANTAGLVVGILVGLVGGYMQFAVMAKRCHDRGRSGWWSLLLLVPIAGLIWAIIDLGVLEGEPGPNAYGPNPLGTVAA